MDQQPRAAAAARASRPIIERAARCRRPRPAPPPSRALQPATGAATDDPQRNFRFFDNRQKYLLFVNTCSEKWVVASRVALELANIHPRPPALRLFDAGVGDGTVLLRVMRAMHDRFPHMPFYIVGKEISLEDVRLALQKMSDRFFEHPATVLVLTNLAYADAPWLRGEVAHGGVEHGVARGAADRQIRRTSSSSRSPTWCRSCRRTGRRASARRPATRSTSGRWCW